MENARGRSSEMGVELLKVLNLPVTIEPRPYIVWHAIDRKELLGATLIGNKMVVASLIWDADRFVCKAKRVGLTFEIVKDLVQLLLLSEEWRTKISPKHAELALGVKGKLDNLIAFWQRNGYNDGWLSELI